MFKLLRRIDHLGVRFHDSIVVIGGTTNDVPVSNREIWIYNLYTEQWRKNHTSYQEKIPPTLEATCGVTIGAHIYMFGGWDISEMCETNALWELSRTTQSNFHWDEVDYQSPVNSLPSPRYDHCGWGYAECLWIFGGYGPSLHEYLNGHGEHDDPYSEGRNNQLLCYDPSTQRWTNPQCLGSVPLPLLSVRSAVVNDKVWLLGSFDEDLDALCALYQLDMHSLSWAKIESCPVTREYLGSLNVISERELVSVNYEWKRTGGNILIMDLTTQTWKEYNAPGDQSRYGNSVALGLNRSVIVTGGNDDTDCAYETYTSTFHVMLETKSLQQLPMKTVYYMRNLLPWKNLPPKLIAQLGLS